MFGYLHLSSHSFIIKNRSTFNLKGGYDPAIIRFLCMAKSSRNILLTWGWVNDDRSFIFVWAAPLNAAQFRNSSNVTMSSLIIHHQISSCFSLSGVACHCALGRSLNTQAVIISAISVAYSPDLSNGATVSTVAAVILNGWRQFQQRSRSSVFPVSPCHLEPVCAVLRVKPRDVCAVLRERSPLPPSSVSKV